MWIPLAALTVGPLMDGSFLVVAMQRAIKTKSELSYWQPIKGPKTPGNPMVMLERRAAIVGLGFAYAGSILSLVGNVLAGNHQGRDIVCDSKGATP